MEAMQKQRAGVQGRLPPTGFRESWQTEAINTTLLSLFYIWPLLCLGRHLIHSHVTPLEGSYSHFRDEELEAGRDEVTCPGRLSYKWQSYLCTLV